MAVYLQASLLDLSASFIVEIIAFIAMILILGRWVYPRVMAAAEARQRAIAEQLAAAERAREQAEERLKDAEAKLQEARSQASAIFEVGQEEGEVEAWAERLERVAEVFSVPELRRVLDDPTVGAERRQAAVTLVLGDRVDGETLNLARLLVESGRTDSAGEIAEV